MANKDHVAILREGVDAWNAWRANESSVRPDVSGVNLGVANLPRHDMRIDLRGVHFAAADLTGTGLGEANLTEADLRDAALGGANLGGALLVDADLRGAFLRWASLSMADLTRAKLSGANLERTNMIEANLTNADLTDCRIYGMSAWDLKLEGAMQQNLIITAGEPEIAIDNIEVAQFIYLLLNNESIRSVIDTITSKVVLILGRFSSERKIILDALRDELRKRNYTPVLFDFEKPASRDLTETVSTLAHMARFVIADITDAKSIPQELQRIVPDLPSVAVQPLLLASQREYGMFEHFRRYPWVLAPVLYDDEKQLLADIAEKVIAPSEKRVREQIIK